MNPLHLLLLHLLRLFRRRWILLDFIVVSSSFLFRSSSVDMLLLHPTHSSSGAATLDSRDVCMHEVFNASCRQGAVILMVMAVYGRMRIGRCINGDFNIGCSKDVLSYFDAQCSTKQACDVSIRNLVEIHPCQRDFTSYLQASYKCIEVAGVGLPVCPRDGKVIVSGGSSGYVSNGVGPFRTLIGSETCPWMLKVRPGQRMTLRLIVLYSSFPTWKTTEDATFVCSATFVLQERDSAVKKYGLCAGKSRERHLYTSAGNEITLYISRDQTNKDDDDQQLLQSSTDRDHPKFVISYEAIGCPDLVVPSNAWMKKVGDNVMIKCNDTMETWYFTCQKNQWIGDWGNCTHRVDLLKNDELREDIFTTHGVVVAVLIGIVLGIFIGMFLLFIVLCSRRRSKRKQKQKRRSSMFVSSRGKEYKEALTNFRRGLRSRDERYPALLTNRDQPCDKAEKMYEFGSDYRGGGGGGYLGNGVGCYSAVALTTTDYGLAAAAAAGEESSLMDVGGQQQMQLVSCHSENDGGPTTRRMMAMDNGGGGGGRGTTTYARIQPCPQCVRRQCQCLLETYVKRDCDAAGAKHPSGGTVMEAAPPPPFGSMLFLQHQQSRLTSVDGSAATKACVISLFQSDTEDGGLHHSTTNRLNPADLPDLHPLSSGCGGGGPSPATSSSATATAADPGRLLASLDQYDDDDDDDAKSLSQSQQQQQH